MGQWKIHGYGGGLVRIGPADGHPSALVGGHGSKAAIADAKLICDSINFCSTKAATKLREKLRRRRNASASDRG